MSNVAMLTMQVSCSYIALINIEGEEHLWSSFVLLIGRRRLPVFALTENSSMEHRGQLVAIGPASSHLDSWCGQIGNVDEIRSCPALCQGAMVVAPG